jgi:hypothetical protein
MRFISRIISQKSVTGLYVHDFVIFKPQSATLHLVNLIDSDANVQVIEYYESFCDFFHSSIELSDNPRKHYEIVSESWHNVDEYYVVCLN